MTLHLTLPPKLGRVGSPPKELMLVYVRDLTVEDVHLMMVSELGSKPKPLQQIRAAHHTVALLLAQGKTPVEVSRITGRSVSNICVLQKDPAFRNLLTHYRQMGEVAMADVFNQLSDVGQAALAALQDKLETDPDSVQDKDKIKIVEMAMDRTGHGPSRTVQNLSTADAIKELVERSKGERKGRIIDVTVG